VLSATWGSLARVFDGLGWADSALWAARRHDEHGDWGPLDVPLLPAVLADRGRFEEATASLGAWAEIQSRRQNIRGALIAHTHLGELYLRREKPDSALVHTLRAESLAVGHNQLEELIEARRLMGEAMMRSGSVDDGLATLHQVADMARAFPTNDAVMRTHVALGTALARVGRRGEALQALAMATEVVEETSAGLEEDVDRARYRARNLDPFEVAIGLLLEASPIDAEAVVHWSQRRKGAALAQSAARALGYGRGRVEAMTVGDIRRALGPGEALLDYVVLDSVVAVTVVAEEQAETLILPIHPQHLHTLVDRLRRPMTTSYAGRIDLARANFNTEAARELFRTIMMPGLSLLGDVRRLVVVPDGSIHDTPLDALSTGPTTALVDDYEVVELPSIRFLGQRPLSGEALDPAASVMVLAGDAPGVNDEVASIGAAWHAGRVAVRLGARASETFARRGATSYQIIHFASHAVADAGDPLASHIRLAADTANDGFLHASEIVDTGMPVQLAVLSACETAAGRFLRGEGLMSLGRAFLAGGAQGVVGTLWPVGPATAGLMEAFYARLAAGAAPAAALREAKLDLRREPATAHPFFWGGFVFMAGAGKRD
jgi:CHAT domain-containing protein